MPRTPKEYADYLSARRDALGGIELPVHSPRSLSGQPSVDEAERIETRKKLILDAFIHCSGDVADGRWMHLIHLCRTSVTRGGPRWLGTNVDRLVLANGDRKSRDARADRGWSEEDCLRQKVESWKQAITHETGVVDGHDGSRKTSTLRRNPVSKTTAGLNFKVAKPNALSNVPKSSNFGSTQHPEQAEISFLPPSFPSHLATSTPQDPGRRKPPPIPRFSTTSPLISSDFPLKPSKIIEHPNQSCTQNVASPALPTLTELLLTHSKAHRPSSASSSPRAGDPIYRRDKPTLPVDSDTSHDRASLDGNLDRQTYTLGFPDVNEEGDFNPPFTSTQKAVAINSSPGMGRDLLWKGYNSQFDVDRRTIDVSELLENDVDIEGWYRKS